MQARKVLKHCQPPLSPPVEHVRAKEYDCYQGDDVDDVLPRPAVNDGGNILCRIDAVTQQQQLGRRNEARRGEARRGEAGLADSCSSSLAAAPLCTRKESAAAVGAGAAGEALKWQHTAQTY